MTQSQENTKAHREFCHECQLAMGGKVPDSSSAVTVYAGQCDRCGKMSTIVPSSDYDWPKQGKRHVWD